MERGGGHDREMTNPPWPRDPSTLAADEVAEALATPLDHGLTAAEASRRLAQHGRNELRVVPRLPAWRRLLAQLRDPLVGLLLAFVARWSANRR